MNEELVARIKALCRERGTSCTKIEAEYGWGNGTIGKWAKLKTSAPVDRLQIVAAKLGVTIQYLVYGEEEKKPAPDRSELTDLQKEAFEMIKQMSPAQLQVLVASLRAAQEK